MRASSFSLSSPSSLLLAVTAAAAGCSSSIAGGGSGGEAPDPTSSNSGWTTTTGVTTSSSGSTTTTTSGGSGCSDPTPVGLPPAACTPADPACGAGSSACLATAHAHGAPEFDLRIAHIALSAPLAFTKGVVKNVFESSTMLNLPGCNLSGAGSFNWLLHVDAAAGTVTVGASKPTSDPVSGYSFINEPLALGGATFPVAPVTLPAALDPACGLSTGTGDVLLPFYGDQGGSTFTIFPLRALRFTATHVTPDHDCIGSYNAAGLSPANACMPDDQHPAFVDGGQFDSLITLEDADEVLVSVLGQTLCVLLSGDSLAYGDGSSPNKCARDSGNAIVFQGDWCSATNGPATGGCADAVRFAGSFAASGTTIH